MPETTDCGVPGLHLSGNLVDQDLGRFAPGVRKTEVAIGPED